MPAPVLIYGYTGEALLSAPRSPDSPDIPQDVRLAGRGEQIMMNLWNGLQGAAMEGSYWLASTLTPGTGIALSVATGTTFLDTQALLGINNTDQSTQQGGQGKSIYPDFILITVTTVPTSATSEHVAHRIDNGQRNSAGTQLGASGVNARTSNMNFGGNSVAQVLALPTVAAATAAVRNVGRNVLRTQIPVAFDQYFIKFASQENAAGGVSVGAAAASVITVFAPPVVIGPNQSYVMNEWAVARSAALSGEVVVGWIER